MKLSGTSKSRQSKYNATVGFVVSAGMLVLVFMVFGFSSFPVLGKIILMLWSLIVIAQGYQAFRNSIFSDKSLHHRVTDYKFDLEGKENFDTHNPKNNFSSKLREVEQLYKDGLLSKEEHLEKRKDILKQDWGS